MILYVESSAVLAWLLGEPRGEEARTLLSTAAAVFTSRLTIAECERGLVRLEAAGDVPPGEVARLGEILSRAAQHWLIHDLGEAVLARAGRRFALEPVRTLDAIHLATALLLGAAEPRLELVSFDPRIRDNARRLGLKVLPAG